MKSAKVGYEAAGKGNNGPIVVQTTIENSQIKDIKVLKNSETPMIGETAIQQLPSKIIASQSLAIDGLSGATRVW